jgi:hypothetical protein
MFARRHQGEAVCALHNSCPLMRRRWFSRAKFLPVSTGLRRSVRCSLTRLKFSTGAERPTSVIAALKIAIGTKCRDVPGGFGWRNSVGGNCEEESPADGRTDMSRRPVSPRALLHRKPTPASPVHRAASASGSQTGEVDLQFAVRLEQLLHGHSTLAQARFAAKDGGQATVDPHPRGLVGALAF